MGDAKVIVYPAWTSNPFLNIIYLAYRAHGGRVRYVRSAGDLSTLLARSGDTDIFHLHWTAPICQRSTTEADAWAALREFQDQVRGFRDRGGRVIWTVHNQLPHEIDHREPEIELSRWLVELADVVHVMAPDTAAAVADHVQIPPDKAVRIPHPSYLGLYEPRSVARNRARADLGIPSSRRAVLFFGQMRPYKGLHVLIDSLNRLAASPEAPMLLLAGPTPAGVAQDLTTRLDDRVEIRRHHGFVSDSEVGRWFAAADLAVFPYERVLNSGSVHLAASLGVPVVLPSEPHLVAQFGQETWVRFFDRADPVSSLCEILVDPDAFVDRADRMRAFAERVSPWRVARQFDGLLRTVHDGGAAR